jgi:hypothetical protein
MNADYLFDPEVEIIIKAIMHFPAKQRRITAKTTTFARLGIQIRNLNIDSRLLCSLNTFAHLISRRTNIIAGIPRSSDNVQKCCVVLAHDGQTFAPHCVRGS